MADLTIRLNADTTQLIQGVERAAQQAQDMFGNLLPTGPTAGIGHNGAPAQPVPQGQQERNQNQSDYSTNINATNAATTPMGRLNQTLTLMQRTLENLNRNMERRNNRMGGPATGGGTGDGNGDGNESHNAFLEMFQNQFRGPGGWLGQLIGGLTGGGQGGAGAGGAGGALEGLMGGMGGAIGSVMSSLTGIGAAMIGVNALVSGITDAVNKESQYYVEGAKATHEAGKRGYDVFGSTAAYGINSEEAWKDAQKAGYSYGYTADEILTTSQQYMSTGAGFTNISSHWADMDEIAKFSKASGVDINSVATLTGKAQKYGLVDAGQSGMITDLASREIMMQGMTGREDEMIGVLEDIFDELASVNSTVSDEAVNDKLNLMNIMGVQNENMKGERGKAALDSMDDFAKSGNTAFNIAMGLGKGEYAGLEGKLKFEKDLANNPTEMWTKGINSLIDMGYSKEAILVNFVENGIDVNKAESVYDAVVAQRNGAPVDWGLSDVNDKRLTQQAGDVYEASTLGQTYYGSYTQIYDMNASQEQAASVAAGSRNYTQDAPAIAVMNARSPEDRDLSHLFGIKNDDPGRFHLMADAYGNWNFMQSNYLNSITNRELGTSYNVDVENGWKATQNDVSGSEFGGYNQNTSAGFSYQAGNMLQNAGLVDNEIFNPLGYILGVMGVYENGNQYNNIGAIGQSMQEASNPFLNRFTGSNTGGEGVDLGNLWQQAGAGIANAATGGNMLQVVSSTGAYGTPTGLETQYIGGTADGNTYANTYANTVPEAQGGTGNWFLDGITQMGQALQVGLASLFGGGNGGAIGAGEDYVDFGSSYITPGDISINRIGETPVNQQTGYQQAEFQQYVDMGLGRGQYAGLEGTVQFYNDLQSEHVPQINTGVDRNSNEQLNTQATIENTRALQDNTRLMQNGPDNTGFVWGEQAQVALGGANNTGIGSIIGSGFGQFASGGLIASLQGLFGGGGAAGDDSTDLDPQTEGSANTGRAGTGGSLASDSRNTSGTGRAGRGSDTDGSHAGGNDYIPFDGYRAELHKGEAVLPAFKAEEYRRGATASMSFDGGSLNLNINVSGNVTGMDASLQRQMMDMIKLQLSGQQFRDTISNGFRRMQNV